MKIQTKCALIGGVFVIIAAGLGLFITKDRTHNTNVSGADNVASAGQSGGITAENIIYNNVSSATPAPPTLVFQSATVERGPNCYMVYLIFLSSTGTTLGKVQFAAQIEGETDATILSFSEGGGFSSDIFSEISADGRYTTLTYSRITSDNHVILRVSNICKVSIYGSHNLKPFVLEIK
jgi:hypothetical protein